MFKGNNESEMLIKRQTNVGWSLSSAFVVYFEHIQQKSVIFFLAQGLEIRVSGEFPW